LLTDAVVDAARANPDVRFVLLDPIVPPAPVPNLAVFTFRQDQPAFLAGALAAMLSTTGVVAGVYGPGGAIDRVNRLAFERGARFVSPRISVLGAYQPPAEGAPYGNPSWGASQADAFISHRADVIFGIGGTTGQGALLAAAYSGRLCIGAEGDSSYQPAQPCLVAMSARYVERGVRTQLVAFGQGHWSAGNVSLGLADGAVALDLMSDHPVAPDIQRRVSVISEALADGTLTTGV
jgi:basic membrane protein A